MSTVEVTRNISKSSPRIASKFIGVYYLLTILTGTFVLLFHGQLAFAADLVVGIAYLVVTAFLYGLSASANKGKGEDRRED